MGGSISQFRLRPPSLNTPSPSLARFPRPQRLADDRRVHGFAHIHWLRNEVFIKKECCQVPEPPM
jgi:hypothetical protein